MSESYGSSCLSCHFSKVAAHRCDGYTFPLGTFRCGCVCQREAGR